MPPWFRAVEFAFWWSVLAGLAWKACAGVSAVSRSSQRQGCSVSLSNWLHVPPAFWWAGMQGRIAQCGTALANSFQPSLPFCSLRVMRKRMAKIPAAKTKTGATNTKPMYAST